MKSPNYQRWNDFNWDDFIQREHLIKTFNNRHLPVLRGEKVLPSKYLADPTQWSTFTPPSSSSSKKQNTTSVSSSRKCSVKRTLMWDFENEKWVPNEMGTEVEETEVSSPPCKRKSTPVPKKKKKKKKTKKTKSVDG